MRKAARALGLDEKVTKDFPTGAVIFLATKLDYPAADFICAHPPFTQIFRYCFDKAPNPQTAPPPDPNKVGAAFLTSDQAMSSFLKVSDDFEDALKKWNSAVKESSEYEYCLWLLFGMPIVVMLKKPTKHIGQ